MVADLRARLAELGSSFPRLARPAAATSPRYARETSVYVSGQVPMIDGKLLTTGESGPM